MAIAGVTRTGFSAGAFFIFFRKFWLAVRCLATVSHFDDSAFFPFPTQEWIST